MTVYNNVIFVILSILFVGVPCHIFKEDLKQLDCCRLFKRKAAFIKCTVCQASVTPLISVILSQMPVAERLSLFQNTSEVILKISSPSINFDMFFFGHD